MKNVTITLDDETAARARIDAAERNMSLSRYVGEVLREHTRGNGEYERAMRRFLSRKPSPLKDPGQPYPKRKELYDRGALRGDEAAGKKAKRG
jgi:hypothetical protein